MMVSPTCTTTTPARAKAEGLQGPDLTSALPFRQAQSSTTIEGRQTQVVTQHFADRILVIVTQVGKIGALTQITTHQRPNYPSMHDDFDDGTDAELEPDRQQQHDGGGSANASFNAVSLQNLFGSVPTGQETLYDFYKEQITALVLAQIQQSNSIASSSMESGLESKPVIVGLSLTLDQTTSSDDDGFDFAALADTERERFQAILALVTQARTW